MCSSAREVVGTPREVTISIPFVNAFLVPPAPAHDKSKDCVSGECQKIAASTVTCNFSCVIQF